VAWTFLARATTTVLAPEHTPSTLFLPEGKGSANHTLSFEVPRTLLDPTKYSSYWKLFRVTAWICASDELSLEVIDALES